MGKISTNPNKTVYQIRREELGLSRDQAAEATNIPADRIEKIEKGKVRINSDDAFNMARGYDAPELCNYFCSHECRIGEQYVPEVVVKDLGQITIEMLVALNKVQEKKDRLLEICMDGKINNSEVEDFVKIQLEMERISLLVDTLQIWLQKTVVEGRIDAQAYEACLKRLKSEQ